MKKKGYKNSHNNNYSSKIYCIVRSIFFHTQFFSLYSYSLLSLLSLSFVYVLYHVCFGKPRTFLYLFFFTITYISIIIIVIIIIRYFVPYNIFCFPFPFLWLSFVSFFNCQHVPLSITSKQASK